MGGFLSIKIIPTFLIGEAFEVGANFQFQDFSIFYSRATFESQAHFLQNQNQNRDQGQGQLFSFKNLGRAPHFLYHTFYFFYSPFKSSAFLTFRRRP